MKHFFQQALIVFTLLPACGALWAQQPAAEEPSPAAPAAVEPAAAASPNSDTTAAEEPPPVDMDFLYFRGKLANLPVANSLKQYDMRFVLYHRFLPDLASKVKTSSSDGGLTSGVTAGFELDFGITDDLDIGSQFATRAKTWDTWLQYRLLNETRMKDYIFRPDRWMTLALRAGVNFERGAGGSNTTGTKGGRSNSSLNLRVITEKRVLSWLRVYVVPGFVTRRHSSLGSGAAGALGGGLYIGPFAPQSPFRFALESSVPLAGENLKTMSWGAAVSYEIGRHSFSVTMTNSTGTTLEHNLMSNAVDEMHVGFQFTRDFSPFNW